MGVFVYSVQFSFCSVQGRGRVRRDKAALLLLRPCRLASGSGDLLNICIGSGGPGWSGAQRCPFSPLGERCPHLHSRPAPPGTGSPVPGDLPKQPVMPTDSIPVRPERALQRCRVLLPQAMSATSAVLPNSTQQQQLTTGPLRGRQPPAVRLVVDTGRHGELHSPQPCVY